MNATTTAEPTDPTMQGTQPAGSGQGEQPPAMAQEPGTQAPQGEEPPAPVVPQAAGPMSEGEAPEAPEASRPNLIERAAAALQSRSGLIQARLAAEARATEAESRVATLEAQVTQLQSALSAAQATEQELGRLLAEAEQHAQSVAAGTVEQLAQAGVPEADLPPATEAGSEEPESFEELQQQIAQEKDPERRAALATRAREVRGF